MTAEPTWPSMLCRLPTALGQGCMQVIINTDCVVNASCGIAPRYLPQCAEVGDWQADDLCKLLSKAHQLLARLIEG